MTATDGDSPEITDDVVLTRYPHVRLDHLNKHFYRGLLGHRLLAGHCDQCDQWHTPLRPRCPHCWSEAVTPRPVRGRGAVYLLTLLHQGPPSPDVDYSTPWPLAAVELVEQLGLRVTATIVECAPDRLRIGLPVELTWIMRDGAPWPAFRPVEEESDVEA